MVDPLAEIPSQIAHSPYAYAWNNPISMIDPTGMSAEECKDCPPPPGWDDPKKGKPMDEVVITAKAILPLPDFSAVNKSNQNSQAGWGGVDAAQMGLDVIGMTEIPFVSQGAELFSAGISFGRGDTFGGLIGLGSMIPILGKTFEATKIARYAAKGVGKFAKIPPGKMTKLKNGQGWIDESGNIWKKDMKHKDHWDISDPKTGKKVKEIDFDGNQIWPDGSKNKNKR